MIRKLLPFIGAPFIVAAYIILKLSSHDVLTVVRNLTLIAFGYYAAYIDIKTHRVPNKLVLVMLAFWALNMVASTVVDFEAGISLIVQSLLSGAVVGTCFLIIYIVSRKGVGGGDIKLVAVMGLYLPLVKLIPLLIISSILAALVSAILLLTKRATTKTSIPFAPFLYVGALVVVYIL